MPPRDIPSTDTTPDSLTPQSFPSRVSAQQDVDPSISLETFEPTKPTNINQSQQSLSVSESVPSLPVDSNTQPAADLDMQYEKYTPAQPKPLSSPISAASNAPFDGISQQSSQDKPVPSKKKKVLLGGAIVSVLLLVVGGGFAAYAAFKNNPQVVLYDVIKNTFTSDTFINSGSVRLKTDQENMNGFVNLTFTNRVHNLKTIGSFKVNADIKYNDLKVNISGDAMVTDSNNIYVKFNNAEKTYDTIFTAFGESYAESPEFSQAAEKMKVIIKKIDRRWIKLEDSADKTKQTRKVFQKAVQCNRNAIDKLYEDHTQYEEIEKAFIKHRFIDLKPTGISKKIENVDSVEYKPIYNVAKSNEFGKAIEASSFTKNIDKCFNRSSDQTEIDTTYAMTPDKIRESQKQFDKANIIVWIGRWDHKIHKITSKSYDNSTKISSDFEMNIAHNKPINIADPKDALGYKELEKDFQSFLGDARLTPAISTELDLASPTTLN